MLVLALVLALVLVLAIEDDGEGDADDDGEKDADAIDVSDRRVEAADVLCVRAIRCTGDVTAPAWFTSWSSESGSSSSRTSAVAPGAPCAASLTRPSVELLEADREDELGASGSAEADTVRSRAPCWVADDTEIALRARSSSTQCRGSVTCTRTRVESSLAGATDDDGDDDDEEDDDALSGEVEASSSASSGRPAAAASRSPLCDAEVTSATTKLALHSDRSSDTEPPERARDAAATRRQTSTSRATCHETEDRAGTTSEEAGSTASHEADGEARSRTGRDDTFTTVTSPAMSAAPRGAVVDDGGGRRMTWAVEGSTYHRTRSGSKTDDAEDAAEDERPSADGDEDDEEDGDVVLGEDPRPLAPR